MNLQVLVSTMHQSDKKLLEQMNIQSDAIIINQCGVYKFEDFIYNGHDIKFYSFAEKGVGLSRNNALIRATADICLFADDDVTYVDKYGDIILSEFSNMPEADVIIFNVISTNESREDFIIKKNTRLRFYNCFKYGTYRIAIRLDRIQKANIHFTLLFGGGAKYSSGEDSLFLAECLRKGLKICASSKIIGSVNHQTSTWFHGYTDKYFIDKGSFYWCLSKRWARLLCFLFVLRHSSLFKKEKTKIEAYRLMIKGLQSMKL